MELDLALAGGRVIDPSQALDGVADVAFSGGRAAAVGPDLASRAATAAPTAALRRPDPGSFKPGSAGDASILDLEDGAFDYVDSTGEHLSGTQRLAAHRPVIGGRWWHPE